MDILILGIILLIVGVGSTFIYDKYKDRLSDINRIKQSFGNPETLIQDSFDKIKKALHGQPKPTHKSKTKKSSQSIEEELLEKFKAHVESQPGYKKATIKTKRTIKPGSIKVGTYNSTQLPEETQYLEELFEDVSTKSTLTVEELIAKIESMKNRPGPKK